MRNRAAYSDWLQTLDYIKNELNIPVMDLRMHMAEPETDNGTVVGGRIYRPNFKKEQSRKVIDMYVRLINTFSAPISIQRPYYVFTVALELGSKRLSQTAAKL